MVIQFRQGAVGEDAEARRRIPDDHLGNGQSHTMQAEDRLFQRNRTCNFVSHAEGWGRDLGNHGVAFPQPVQVAVVDGPRADRTFFLENVGVRHVPTRHVMSQRPETADDVLVDGQILATSQDCSRKIDLHIRGP